MELLSIYEPLNSEKKPNFQEQEWREETVTLRIIYRAAFATRCGRKSEYTVVSCSYIFVYFFIYSITYNVLQYMISRMVNL